MNSAEKSVRLTDDYWFKTHNQEQINKSLVVAAFLRTKLIFSL